MDTQNKTIKFVSGNAKKFKEVKDIIEEGLPGYTVVQIKIDLPEIQGDPLEITKEKLKHALLKEEGPLMIEDTSLCFNALKGLPGPYIKDFLDKLGVNGLNTLIHGFEDKSAYAQCIFGLGNKEGNLNTFVGRTPGKIVEPRGDINFGWDPIFNPDGFEETYSEMDKKIKNKISHRYNSLKLLIEFLKENPNYIH
jgi:inosine triphosphate pyrophosphatase